MCSFSLYYQSGVGSGVLAHGSICSHYFVTYFGHILKYENIETKNSTYIFTCYASTKSSPEKLTCRLACIKKINCIPKNKFFRMIILSFFIHHKISVFTKFYKHTYCGDVPVEFFVQIF
jgi:hypothetical protein